MVKEKIGYKGLIDVGIIVLSHCRNPAQNSALNFFTKVLKLEVPCIIPTSVIIGAYHVLTNYLKINPIDAKNSLLNTLQFKKPIFIENVSLKFTKRSIELAEKYKIQSWDGYIVAIMDEENISTIYTLDISDFSKIDWISAINPIDKEEYTK